MLYKRVAGTKDILPSDIYPWQEIERISRETFSLYNYREIRPPLLEDVALFNHSLGDTTEIVQKQMFLIQNKDETYALRPEGTASIARAYIENNLDKTAGFTKLYYLGPMFRLERPQKGRLRQFHHIGCEVIGSYGPEIDIEVISLADTLLKKFSVHDYTIKLNSLGCEEDRKRLAEMLRTTLQPQLNSLCADCQIRFQKNILRILDCKNPECQEIVQKLSLGSQHLCNDCGGHFNRVKEGLDLLRIAYVVSPLLVRGLDYYTRTVFEISQKDLGAQDAIGAGGRYDNLIQNLGGPQAPAIGFAFGMERILLATGSALQAKNNNLVYIIPLGIEAQAKAVSVLHTLRDAGIASDTDYEGKSLKAAMRKANDSQASCVLILGENELKKNTITVKDMRTGTQEEIPLERVVDHFKRN